MGAIIFEGDFIVSGQFSGGGGGAVFLGGNCSGGTFPRGKLSGGQFCSGAIVRRAHFLRGNCPNTLGEIVRGSIVRTPYFGSLWY